MSVKTFAGIDNFFFLEKMYGTTDIFSDPAGASGDRSTEQD